MTSPVLAARPDRDLDSGSVLPELRKPPITKLQLVKYAGASGDYNLIHTDDETARRVGLDGVIAHGMLIMGFVGQLLSNYVGPTTLRKFGVRFKGMTHIDDVITCTGTVTQKYEADGEARIAGKVQAVDQNGDVKVAATFIAALPRRN